MSTLKVDTILKRTGTGTITVGQSGDTISIPSGATLNSAGTNTLEGIANTPRFSVYLDATQAVANNTWTKIVFNDEDYDSDSAFDTSNGRFTVPSGKEGVYVFTFSAQAPDMPNATSVACRLYVNGSDTKTIGGTVRYQGWTQNFTAVGSTSNNNMTGVAPINLSVGDYVELYIRQNGGGSDNLDIEHQNFAGYKLIG